MCRFPPRASLEIAFTVRDLLFWLDRLLNASLYVRGPSSSLTYWKDAYCWTVHCAAQSIPGTNVKHIVGITFAESVWQQNVC
jgi:hypothetical protein